MRWSALIAVVLCVTHSRVSGGDDVSKPETGAKQDVTAQQADFFEARIRPVLEEHCFRCHGPRKQESGLRLDSRDSMSRGSDNGPVVVAGHPEESPLIEAIGYGGPVKMPPKSKLPFASDRRYDQLGADGPTLAGAMSGDQAKARVETAVPPAQSNIGRFSRSRILHRQK